MSNDPSPLLFTYYSSEKIFPKVSLGTLVLRDAPWQMAQRSDIWEMLHTLHAPRPHRDAWCLLTFN